MARAVLRGGDRVLRLLTGTGAFVVVAAFATLVVLLANGGWPALHHAAGFFTGSLWNPNEPDGPDAPAQSFGALPFIYGTLASSLIALAVAVPVAVGTAIALVELLPRWLATPVGLLVELLAAVPSIIFGVWGFFVVVPFVKHLGADVLHRRILSGTNLLAGGLVLAVMVLPILTAVARDMLRAVPRHQRDAALALGATNWEVTWRVTLPNARGGLLAASLLGLGRAIGETMAVIMVIGMTVPKHWFGDVFQPASTIAGVIANQFGEPVNDAHKAALWLLGLTLLACSLALNLLARAATRRFTRRMGATP